MINSNSNSIYLKCIACLPRSPRPFLFFHFGSTQRAHFLNWSISFDFNLSFGRRRAFLFLLLLFLSQSLNTQSKMCGIFMRVYDCLSVCVWFQHIRAHQRANQHITSSCRNFEEIDFCRLILSKVEIDCVISLARRLLMYLVQQWTNRNAIHIRTKRKRNKTKQNISLAHLTIFIHDMDVFA